MLPRFRELGNNDVTLNAEQATKEVNTFPDPGLRELSIMWTRMLVRNDGSEEANIRLTELANAIIATKATTCKGVGYKITAAYAWTAGALEDEENDPVRLFLSSVLDDLGALTDADGQGGAS